MPAPDLAYRMAFDNVEHLVTFGPATVQATPDLERHLPPRRRLVNLLVRKAPMKVQDIAELTGLAASTVKKELNAAPRHFVNLNRSTGTVQGRARLPGRPRPGPSRYLTRRPGGPPRHRVASVVD